MREAMDGLLRSERFAVQSFASAEEFLAVPSGEEPSCLVLDVDVPGIGFQALTRRERQVLQLVVSGMLNKQIGFELGISEVTVKIHRGHVMRKTRASSLADLVRMADRFGNDPGLT